MDIQKQEIAEEKIKLLRDSDEEESEITKQLFGGDPLPSEIRFRMMQRLQEIRAERISAYPDSVEEARIMGTLR